MTDKPRSAKRRRLNSSPEPQPPSTGRTTRSTRTSTRKAANNNLDVQDDVTITQNPVIDIVDVDRTTPKKSTPLRQYTKKDLPSRQTASALSATPSRRQTKARALLSVERSNGRSAQGSARSRRAQEILDEDEEEASDGVASEQDEDELNADVPELSRSSRKANARLQEELSKATPRRTVKNDTATPKSRRKQKTAQADQDDEQEKAETMEGLIMQAETPAKTSDTRTIANGIGTPSKPTPAKTSSTRTIANGINPPSKPTPTTQDPFSTLKSAVIAKLARRRPIPLRNLDAEYSKLHALLHATVTAGESNSLLLIGARGSGKTAMLNAALQDLSRSQKEHFHTIRLNGFIQTDDKLALREIWRQLGREMEIDDAEDGSGPGKSYADTLTMLLALLSHPDEIAGTADGSSGTAKSVIFVMDEFDLFATHARQTLLYNLLDIAQSRKAPIAVIGLTTRIDVTEALEKRVKSRFSHRYLHISLSRTLSEFVDVVKAAVRLEPGELTFEEKSVLLGGAEGEKSVSASKKRSKASTTNASSGSGNLLPDWNAAVENLFTTSSFLKTYINTTYYTTKSIPSVLSSLFLPISTLTTIPTPADFTSSNSTILSLTPPDSNLHLLPSLSDLALSLLIAASRLSVIHSTDTTNFPLAYAEYISLASKARINSAASGALASGSGTRVFGKEVARREWERLVGLGLLIPVTSGAFGSGGGAVKGRAVEAEMMRVDVALEEIPLSVEMSAVMEKWCLQI